MDQKAKQYLTARKKHHIIYKTTCLISGRYYIGLHSTDNLDDGYTGSGKRLWQSIKKHGIENHRCEIIEHLPSRIALRAREAELVTEELIGDPMCMNIALGGGGGWEHVNAVVSNTDRSIYGRLGYETAKMNGILHVFDYDDGQRGALASKLAGGGFFSIETQLKGRLAAASADACKKRQATMKAKSSEQNPMFGKQWFHLDDKVVLVNKEYSTRLQFLGWKRGKKNKIEPAKQPKILTDKWNWFDAEKDKILTEFDQHRSISKILHDRGFEKRAGNARLSKWLQTHGRKPLQRRNSKNDS